MGLEVLMDLLGIIIITKYRWVYLSEVSPTRGVILANALHWILAIGIPFPMLFPEGEDKFKWYFLCFFTFVLFMIMVLTIFDMLRACYSLNSF